MVKILNLVLIIAIFNLKLFAQGNCIGGKFEMVKPFLGTWKEYTITDTSEIFIGTLISELKMEGCVLQQRFVSPDSSFSYLSFGYLEDEKWTETYVFSNGGIANYIWSSDGKDVITERVGGSRKIKYLHRLRLTNILPNSYEVIEEHSTDGWRTWDSVELTEIRRQ